MEFRQLKYFVAVAEELHFGRAAKKVGIAQPALSQQIQQLEQDLGGKLFVRTKRTVALTDAGKLFLNQAKMIITQADYAVNITRQAFSGVFGELVIGFVESTSWDIPASCYRNIPKEISKRKNIIETFTYNQSNRSFTKRKYSYRNFRLSGK